METKRRNIYIKKINKITNHCLVENFNQICIKFMKIFQQPWNSCLLGLLELYLFNSLNNPNAVVCNQLSINYFQCLLTHYNPRIGKKFFFL